MRLQDLKNSGNKAGRVFYRLRASSFGDFAVVWSVRRGRPGVIRIFLSNPREPAKRILAGNYPRAIVSSCPEIDSLAGLLAGSLKGEAVKFPLDILRLDLCSAFQKKVLRAEHAIPRGQVSTYSRIAARIGHPGGARAVGSASASNPFPLIIPCHRVIRSDGAPGGYQGGGKMKRALLDMERRRSRAEGRPFRKRPG